MSKDLTGSQVDRMEYQQERVAVAMNASQRSGIRAAKRGVRGARSIGFGQRASQGMKVHRGVEQRLKRKGNIDAPAIVSPTSEPPWVKRRRNRAKNKVARASRKVNR